MPESVKTAQRRLSELEDELLALGDASGTSKGLAVHLVRITKCISDLWDAGAPRGDHGNDHRKKILRAAVDLAVFLPSLPLTRKPSPGVACTATPVPARPSLLTSLCDAQAACELACLLLEFTAALVAQGFRVEPGELYRLASCAGVALGPASEVTQQAYASLTEAASQSQTPAEMAHALADCYGPLLGVAGRAVFLLLHLEGAAPAAALKATICRPDKLVALCHQCVPVLQWCADELGRPPLAALESLSQLVSQSMSVHPASVMLLAGGPSGPALAWAAVTQLASASQQVLQLRVPRRGAGVGPAPKAGQQSAEAGAQRTLASWESGCAFLHCVAPWLTDGTTDAAAAPAAAATAWLLRLSAGLGESCPRLDDSAAALALLVRPVVGAATAGQPSRQGERTQQPAQQEVQQQGRPTAWAGVPVFCIEAAAVCCAALCAGLDRRMGLQLGSGREPQAEEWVEISPYDLGCLSTGLTVTLKLVGELVCHVARRCCGQPAPLEPLLATLESVLRLAGRLVALGPRLKAAARSRAGRPALRIGTNSQMPTGQD